MKPTLTEILVLMVLLMMGYSTFNAYRIRGLTALYRSIPSGIMQDELERLDHNQKELIKNVKECNYSISGMREQIDMFVSEQGSYE